MAELRGALRAAVGLGAGSVCGGLPAHAGAVLSAGRFWQGSLDLQKLMNLQMVSIETIATLEVQTWNGGVWGELLGSVK